MVPELNRVRKASTHISVFRGLNRTVNTAFSRVNNNSAVYFTEFENMKNLSGDDYPQIGTRKLRLRTAATVKSNLLASGGKLIYVTVVNNTGKLRVGTDEYTISGYQNQRHYLTQHGNNIIIQPEKLYFNISTHEFKAMEFTLESNSVSPTALNVAKYNSGSRIKDSHRHINFRDFSIEKVELDDFGKPRTVNYIYEKASGLDNYDKQTSPSNHSVDSDNPDTAADWQDEYYQRWGTIRTEETVEAQGESPSGVYRCIDVMKKQETVGGVTYQTYSGLLRFIRVETNYVKISRIADGVTDLLAGVKKGDFVKISGMSHSVPSPLVITTAIDPETGNEVPDKTWDSGNGWGNYIDVLNGNTFKVYYADDDCIVINAAIEKSVPYNGAMTIERVMPPTDSGIMLEVNNRLWACSSANNEIYSCRQGDCTNWQAYGDGIATDSYAATVGCEGGFTGIARQNDSVIFFKENWIIKLFGTKPSNFALASYNVPGVEQGSEKSVVWINGALYYLSHLGVCQYSPGGQPVVISRQAFGNGKYKNAVAGRHRNKYYISAQNENGEYELFVLDTDTGLWHREDNTRMTDTATYNNVLYYVDGKTEALMCADRDHNILTDTAGISAEQEGSFDWSFETGNMYEDMFEKKYISRVQFSMKAAEGTRARILAQFCSGGAWFLLRETGYQPRRVCRIPVAVRRADYLRLRVEGSGECLISGIEIEYSGGSSKTWQF